MSVLIYSTPTCTWCQLTKKWLAEKGVNYEDLNVAEDQQKAKEMIEKSGQMNVPMLDINGTIIVGFSPEKMEKALGKL